MLVLKKPEEYLENPYARILIPDERGTFFAEILEFPGCIAQGATPEEAFTNLEKTARDWIRAALDQGQEVPPPTANQGFSGKLILRLPRGLHRRAAQMAERDRTSLNQFLVTAIAERVGAYDLLTRMIQGFSQTHVHYMPVHIASTSIHYLSSGGTNLPIPLVYDKKNLLISWTSKITQGTNLRAPSRKRIQKRTVVEAKNG